MYAHVEQHKNNTICPTDQTDKLNDEEVKRGRPICFYRFFVSLFDFIHPILYLHPIPLPLSTIYLAAVQYKWFTQSTLIQL